MKSRRSLPLINLHTHSVFSDGVFEPIKIVETAIDKGLSHIAITDHYQTTKVQSVQMSEIPYYLQTVRALSKRYSDRITVLAGLEIDTNPQRTDLMDLPFELLNACDFVLLEYVCDIGWGGIGFNDFLRLLRKFQIPVGLAHTDLTASFSKAQLEELHAIMLERDQPPFIELSASRYYWRRGKPYYEYATQFLKSLKGTSGTTSIGSDTHGKLAAMSNVKDCSAFLATLELLDTLVTEKYWPRNEEGN